MSTTYKSLNWSVQLDPDGSSPATITDICLGVEISLGTDQENASCIATFSEYPSGADVRQYLYVYGTLDGGSPPILFNGEVASIRWQPLTDTTILECTDYMARLKFPWSKEDRSYDNEDASSVKQNLVEASGIDASLTHIEAPAGWDIGVSVPVTLVAGDTPLELIRLIDESMPLWKTYTRSNGAIYSEPMATGSAVATYSFGSAPLIDVETTYTLDGLINACKVIGATYNDVPVEEIYQAASGYVPDPPEYITKVLQSYLIEDPTRAAQVAEDVVTALNGPRYLVSARVALAPEVQPGLTVNVDGTDYYVTSVKHSIPACITSFEGTVV